MCSRCHIADYRVLVFHHTNPLEKDFAVAEMAKRGGSLKRLQAEIAKCIVLCANCHLIEHYNGA